jgi:hypothetical protein
MIKLMIATASLVTVAAAPSLPTPPIPPKPVAQEFEVPIYDHLTGPGSGYGSRIQPGGRDEDGGRPPGYRFGEKREPGAPPPGISIAMPYK